MPRSALPEHLNDPEEIEANFPDDADNGSWFRWLKKQTKTWLAFGPRCTEWWAKFREWPVLLFAVGDNTRWRMEDDIMDWSFGFGHTVSGLSRPFGPCYLSRVQYNKKWHIQIQWPLFLQIQVLNWQGYIGFKRDADKVYWLALYLGRTWK